MISRKEMKQSVADAINDGMAAQGITHIDLAIMIGKPRQTTHRVATGKGLPNLYTMYVIADVLETTIDEMIRYKSIGSGQSKNE